ncbi:hypothetical protein FGF66_02100 [Chlorobaculum thiosulfatiphilum]|uniref:Uncharacterized protein n=1 Tax=Chlorobaculum thiosulfatiphilum TaxID=115852 RepID=A0A5C4SA07_CHLTI|nr:hypothetical protein [Chlorobaculum thiosulfatiphilum]NTV82622.1 hypothetical protein [Chlorobaculum sp.]TNJ40102.1 hypothetical protein FGF66_02100 [Chlorobaculum thiosulfatiphilum]
MKPEEDSPFFYRCHLKASRKAPDAKSESAEQGRSGQSSYSDAGKPEGAGRLNDSPDYSERNASRGFDGD